MFKTPNWQILLFVIAKSFQDLEYYTLVLIIINAIETKNDILSNSWMNFDSCVK